MKTLEMEVYLMSHFSHNIVVPNVSDVSYLVHFETDLLMLSEADYATAIEIKVSKSDLKNDLKKRHIEALTNYGGAALSLYFRNLKHFYYAVPVFLKETALEQIPNFAGLLTVEIEKYDDGYYRPYMRPKVLVAKKPQLLFKDKWSEKMRNHLTKLGTERVLTAKSALLQFLNTKEEAEKSL